MKNVIRFPAIAVVAGLTSLAACSPTMELRGNLPHPEQVAQIEVGKTTQDEVLTLIGTPSSTMNYGEEIWHYISTRTEQLAFFEPKVLDRTVLSLSFDAKGVVKDVQKKTLKDSRDITTVDRETPTAGKDFTILEQLLGNVGRFSKDSAKK